jgi:SAM-dependent methyltransferase
MARMFKLRGLLWRVFYPQGMMDCLSIVKKLIFSNHSARALAQRRWQVAQKHEKQFWKQWFFDHPQANDDEWLLTVMRYFEIKENQDFKDSILVDIGSGPIGILTKIKGQNKIAVDPLEIDSVDNSICRLKAQGEHIPLPQETADFVFIYNVLQHVASPEDVLDEAYRILKRNGICYVLDQLNLPTCYAHPNSLKLELFNHWVSKWNLDVVQKSKEDDCYFDHPSCPGSGYAILYLKVRKRNGQEIGPKHSDTSQRARTKIFRKHK